MTDADEQLLASADGRLDDLRERLVPAEALRADLEPSTPAREEKLARLAELQAEVKKLQAEIDPEALPISSPPPERGSFVSMALPPALARAMVIHRMPGWKRALMRPNWSWISNAFFFGSCVGYTVSACWGLQYDRAVPLLNISGRELIAYGYLFGALGFLIEPLFDVLGCWVEAWDDILYTAKEASEQMLSPTRSIGQGLAPTYTAQSVAWLMVREPYFWAAVVFELGSVLYFWQALVPFVYGDFCDRCGFHWQQAWFVCVDLEQGYPDRRMLWERGGEGLNGTAGARRLAEEGSDGGHSGSWYNSRDHGYCAMSWLGALVFAIDALICIYAWRHYRDDVEEALAVPGGRRLVPCTRPRFRRTEWLGWAAWLFLLGAVCEIADDFMPDPYSDYLELGTQVCWITDSVMYMLDQGVMEAAAEERELPVLRIAASGKAKVEWKADADELGIIRIRRSSRMVDYNRGGRRRSSVVNIGGPHWGKGGVQRAA